ncbi:hypothetical protein GZH46_01169 [Fragariocoptes setiger]|uniref:Uncharacterized protein n=1 Tax=Fragariocoptes setiger TaxID=1670756 RepID=A0ABQ7SA72_9ACAR|nr:hypothetical protein GZH46_01169 [Fragariocoptes setiger]
MRCQQDVLRDIQSTGSNGPISQYPISSGPPYSVPTVANSLSTTCRMVRINLDCLLATTPACIASNFPSATNTDTIIRAKRFLEQNGCNSDGNWQNSNCYRGAEIRNCEERFGFTSGLGQSLAAVASGSNYMGLPSTAACINYQSLKQCAEQHARMQCKASEAEMINEYLLDRGSDLAWRCMVNGSYYAQQQSYSGSQQQSYNGGSSLAAQQYTPYDQQRPIYSGGSRFNTLMPSERERWDRYNNPYNDGFGLAGANNGFMGAGGFRGGLGNQVSAFDRLTSGGLGSGIIGADLLGPDMLSDCPNRAAPFTRECEDNLADQRRSWQDSRSGNEVQRRLCCALYQYRDCISRVVLDRCSDSSPTAVDILMQPKNREFVFTCRDFSRDICSGSQPTMLVSFAVLVSSLLSALFVHSLGSVVSSPTTSLTA